MASTPKEVFRTFTSIEDARSRGFLFIKPMRPGTFMEFPLRKTLHPNSELSVIAKEQMLLDIFCDAVKQRDLCITELKAMLKDRINDGHAIKPPSYDRHAVAAHYRCHFKNVEKIYRNALKGNGVDRTAKRGRKGMSIDKKRHVVTVANKCRGKTMRGITKGLKVDPPPGYKTLYKGNERISPCMSTVNKILTHEAIMRIIKKKPLVTEVNRVVRLDWCKRHFLGNPMTVGGNNRINYLRRLRSWMDTDEMVFVYSFKQQRYYCLPDDLAGMEEQQTECIFEEMKHSPPSIFVSGLVTCPTVLNAATCGPDDPVKICNVQNGWVCCHYLQGSELYKRRTATHQVGDAKTNSNLTMNGHVFSATQIDVMAPKILDYIRGEPYSKFSKEPIPMELSTKNIKAKEKAEKLAETSETKAIKTRISKLKKNISKIEKDIAKKQRIIAIHDGTYRLKRQKLIKHYELSSSDSEEEEEDDEEEEDPINEEIVQAVEREIVQGLNKKLIETAEREQQKKLKKLQDKNIHLNIDDVRNELEGLQHSLINTKVKLEQQNQKLEEIDALKEANKVEHDRVALCLKLAGGVEEFRGKLDSGRTFVQEDNAGGHGFARTKPTPVQVALWKTMDERNVQYFCQPPNSPEFNMLDLGIWHSIKALMRDKCQEIPMPRYRTKRNIEQLMAAKLAEIIESYDGQKCLSVALQKQNMMMHCIAMNGGPVCKEPHNGIRKKWGIHSS